MMALCRLSVLGLLALAVSTDAAAVLRKKKHHHHHRHHVKHRRHPNASSVNATNTTASNKATGSKNATDGAAGPRGLLDVSRPSASHGTAAIHAAAHAALHRHVATRVGHLHAPVRRPPKGAADAAPLAPGRLAAAGAAVEPPPARQARREDPRDRTVAENRSMHNGSRNATEPPVALAHTAVRVNASARAERHPRAHRRQPVAPSVDKGAAHEEKDPEEAPAVQRGELLVGGPLPPDFEERFVEGVSEAARVPAEAVRVLRVGPAEDAEGADVDTVVFTAPANVVQLAEDEAGDSNSDLARGPLHVFLVDRAARDGEAPAALAAPAAEGAGEEAEAPERRQSAGEEAPAAAADAEAEEAAQHGQEADAEEAAQHGQEEDEEEAPPPQEEAPPTEHAGREARAGGRTFDVDGEMPYGDLEPFGREDTAAELTGSSILESDQMVDQLERAEVAEEKRAVFRALTRLRGAAITSFDGIARSQTGNIDEYNKRHRWRDTHPLHHLADEESDVAKWAFPEDC